MHFSEEIQHGFIFIASVALLVHVFHVIDLNLKLSRLTFQQPSCKWDEGGSAANDHCQESFVWRQYPLQTQPSWSEALFEFKSSAGEKTHQWLGESSVCTLFHMWKGTEFLSSEMRPVKFGIGINGALTGLMIPPWGYH